MAEWTMRSAEWIGMHAPRRAGLWLGRSFLRLQYERDPRQRRTVAMNLSRVLGHPPDSGVVQLATKEAFDLYGRYWYETFALRTMPWEEVNRRFSLEGLEHLDRALEAGRGAVMALPHMGNWDAAGHWLSINGYRMTAVAEELKPTAVFDLFYRHRRALGMDIVPLSEGKRVGERLVRLLSENRAVTLLADRNLSGRGVEVEMFGGPVKLPTGPALLALSTGAPLFPCVVFTTDEGWHCRIEAPLDIARTDDLRADVSTAMRAVGARFERFISAAPTDWHMFQPAWDEDVPPAEGPGLRVAQAASASAPT
jgi:KDO2-lipid IV(A) lauroyltransferase